MKYCNHCGNEIKEGESFCNLCGMKYKEVKKDTVKNSCLLILFILLMLNFSALYYYIDKASNENSSIKSEKTPQDITEIDFNFIKEECQDSENKISCKKEIKNENVNISYEVITAKEETFSPSKEIKFTMNERNIEVTEEIHSINSIDFNNESYYLIESIDTILPNEIKRMNYLVDKNGEMIKKFENTLFSKTNQKQWVVLEDGNEYYLYTKYVNEKIEYHKIAKNNFNDDTIYATYEINAFTENQ